MASPHELETREGIERKGHWLCGATIWKFLERDRNVITGDLPSHGPAEGLGDCSGCLQGGTEDKSYHLTILRCHIPKVPKVAPQLEQIDESCHRDLCTYSSVPGQVSIASLEP